MREGFLYLARNMYAAVRGENIYAAFGGTIFRVDISTEKWSAIGTLPVKYGKRSIGDDNFYRNGDELLFFQGSGIYIFDLRTEERREIIWGEAGDNDPYISEKWENRYLLVPHKGDRSCIGMMEKS